MIFSLLGWLYRVGIKIKQFVKSMALISHAIVFLHIETLQFWYPLTVLLTLGLALVSLVIAGTVLSLLV